MLIAIDYDDTYTLDKSFWDTFIDNAYKCGHQVIVVTARGRIYSEEVLVDLEDKVDDILFTEWRAKRAYTANKGYMPDVWIDDCPEMIVSNPLQLEIGNN